MNPIDTIIKVPADGLCLFHSVLWSLRGEHLPWTPQTLKIAVAQELIRHAERYCVFLIDTNETQFKQKVCRELIDTVHWSGSLFYVIPRAIATCIGYTICIFTMRQLRSIYVYPYGSHTVTPVVSYIYYDGVGHYDCVKPSHHYLKQEDQQFDQ